MHPFRSPTAVSLLLAAAVVALAPPAAAGQNATEPFYTAAQAAEGQKAYEASCARCHGSDLAGKDDAPPLAGAYFGTSWGGHKVSQLLEFVAGNMPMDEPGTLAPETYVAAVAYILARNGIPAGRTSLAKGAEGVIIVPAPGAAQQVAQQAARVSASFEGTAMTDVLAFFAQFARRSIVAGAGVTGVVSAEIHDQPWDVALEALLVANGLFARELEKVEDDRQTPERIFCFRIDGSWILLFQRY